ncbi:MAG: PD-(D/E)XK nuclease family protein, partial [Clostridia bacterium]|nr:PD-(D/E)XK nuclease family protein [Clostridia bacterium]
KEEEEEEEDTVYSDEAEDKEEVKAVVSLVRRLLTEGKRVTGEPILPKDIAILLRGGKAKSKILCRALQKAGIAAHTEDKTSLFDLPEILLTLSLLHTVNNPHKDVYLAGLLRSPLYGFTMEDLVRIKKDRPRGETLYTSFCLYLAAHPDFEKGKRFAEDLEDFRFSAKNMPADGLLRYLWDKTDFVSAVPEENKPNLHLIYEYARQCEASGYHGLFRFLRFLDEQIKGGATESRTVGNPDGVTVGTVHGAKGLEYPVCILTDLMRSTPNRESPLLMHPSLGFGFRLRDETGLALFTTPFFRIVEKALYVGSAEEELRVLYVALTRAQEQLYFTMSVGRSTPETLLRKARLLKRFPTKTGILSANCFGNLILPNLPEDTVKAVIPPSVDDAAVLQIPERKTQPEAPAGEPDTGLFDLLKRQVSFTYPFAAETAMPRKLSVSALYPGFLDEKEADLPILTEDPVYEPPFFISHKEKDPGAKAGIATHLFLQFCRYENLKNPTLEKVEAEKNRLVRERFLPEKDGEKIRSAELMGFFRSEIFRSVLEASAVRREFRFHVKLPVTLFTETAREQFGKDTEVLVQGVIDLLTEDRDGKLHLFDYKTDRLPKEALADDEKAKTILLERYQNQLTYYALAVRCIFGKEPEEIKLFSLHTGKAYDVPPALPLTASAEEER